MEISSLCIINKNYDTKICNSQNLSPDSVDDYSKFNIHKDTTRKHQQKGGWCATINVFSGKAVFVFGGVVWTLTATIVTICILMFMDIL